MASRQEIVALVERVEGGNGDDHKLSVDVACAVGEGGRISESEIREAFGGRDGPWTAWVPQPRRYLFSRDAVEELRERLLPGSEIAISRRRGAGQWQCSLRLNNDDDFGGVAATESRARLAAILRAFAAGMA